MQLTNISSGNDVVSPSARRHTFRMGALRHGVMVVGLVLGVCGWPGPSRADSSKLTTDAIHHERGHSPGKNKMCCGYPLAEPEGFKHTFYWMADQNRHVYSSIWSKLPDSVLDIQAIGELVGTQTLYTPSGMFLGMFSKTFVKELRMEGSGWLADGTPVNYAGRCRYGVGTCFEILDPKRYPYGRGAGRRHLVPFRSVAVDRRLIPLGDTLYVPEWDGMRLPDGSVHDGCVRADDTGGAIRNRLIDFFVAELENFLWVNQQMFYHRYITPHVEHPRCDYLREPR